MDSGTEGMRLMDSDPGGWCVEARGWVGQGDQEERLVEHVTAWSTMMMPRNRAEEAEGCCVSSA